MTIHWITVGIAVLVWVVLTWANSTPTTKGQFI
jgi:hypothetical protein